MTNLFQNKGYFILEGFNDKEVFFIDRSSQAHDLLSLVALMQNHNKELVLKKSCIKTFGSDKKSKSSIKFLFLYLYKYKKFFLEKILFYKVHLCKTFFHKWYFSKMIS